MILAARELTLHTEGMNSGRAFRFVGLSCLTALLCCLAQGLPAGGSDPGWPRHYSNGTASLVVYHPQIETWSDFKVLRGRCAFGLTIAPNRDPLYGTFRFEGETLVDPDQKLVLVRNLRALDMRFPSAPGGASAQWSELAKQMFPTDALVVSLDRILAYIHAGEVSRKEARVLTDPPPIFVSMQPAVLVIVGGDPIMVEAEKTSLRRVVNTNWDLFQDGRSNLYYLRQGKSWLVAKDMHDAFVPATELPPDLDRLPADQDPEPGTASKAQPATASKVIVSHRPSELIVIRGAPDLEPIPGTQLASVMNTESDLFFYGGNRSYYFLVSGRWFSSSDLKGPWQYATASLPTDFKKIPQEHPRAHVLAAVPGTREAEDAVLLAAIPRTAEINRNEAKADVQYVGTPEFTAIPGTSVEYAKNTPNDVLRIGNSYYLCTQGVWFVSASPSGPWKAADKVPQEIYAIPESSPKYHVTYVRIYESTPATIVVGYTPGYYGAYVSGGVVVWGTGYYYRPYAAVSTVAVPVYWGPTCYTYGASAWYNPATGIYSRGSAVYGPYGGYGAGAAYNPRTGAYSQGAAAWGPGGGVAAGRTYNPTTGAYPAGYSAANAYGSWGQGVVGNGNNWGRGGYQSNSRGTVAAGQTSKGGAGAAFEGAGGNSGYVAKSASGDIYAGANGKVYKRDDGQWYQNQNGSWNAMDKNQLNAQREQAAARDHGSWNAQASEKWRANAGAAGG